MSDTLLPVPKEWKSRVLIDAATYQRMYAESVDDPEGFWREQANRLDWMVPFTKVKDVSWDPDDLHIRWFEDGCLNVSANCVDRHLEKRGSQTAILWEGDDPGESRSISYAELHREVCRFANVLKAHGVKKGDRVTIYLPMIPETAYAMLACARIGAVHSVIFAGFSPDSIAGRVQDCASTIVITADEGLRGGKPIPLKNNTDEALLKCPEVKTVIVVKRTGGAIEMKPGRDVWYRDEAAKVPDDCPAEAMNAEDPLFILYTSGSTGKPKGVLHTSGGYLMYAAFTHQIVFDYHDGDIYWCTADVGWVTGHSYIVYGPLANGATTLMFEGVPNHPSTSRFWEVIDKHKVNIFYTAPTAIRALMREGEAPVKRTSRASLRLLGSVGEPINPEAWLWYHRTVGDGRCPIVDTWWQTETGGILISPLPGATDLSPARRPSRCSGSSRSWWTRTARSSTARSAAISCSPRAGRARCARSMATTSASSTPISRPIAASTSPATAAAATRTATTGSPAVSTTSSTSRATASAPPRSRARWSRIATSPRRPWSAIRTTSRARASTPSSR